jgi:hypothetical protein
MQKMKLELRPYTALAILCLCRTMVNDDTKNSSTLVAIHESIQEYEDEILRKISTSDLGDALLEQSINVLTGRQPNTKV